MQSRIDHFINDFYYDIDSRTESKTMAMRYIDENISMSVFGELFKETDGFISWFNALKAGFEESFHQVKNVEITEQIDHIDVDLQLVWTGGFRNMGENNKVKHNLLAKIQIIDDGMGFKIKDYKCKAVQ